MSKIHLYSKSNKEQSRDAIKRAMWKSDGEMALRESIRRDLGVDIADPEAFPAHKSSFDWTAARAKLREADGVTTQTQLLRAGIQSAINASLYETVDTTWSDWAHTVTSTKMEELYAPLHGIGFPSQVGEGEQYPEVSALGLDIKLQNKKFGSMYPATAELVNDDQTGQVQRMAALMGEYAAQLVEVWSYGKLASVAGMSYAGIQVPVSETQPADEASYPWSTALVGGGKTRPAAYGAFNQGNIQAGMTALMNQLNLLGLKMSVRPDRILISPKFRFDAAVLLNSGFYPTGATAGATGGAFSVNPLAGIADLTVSRFMFDQSGSVNADSKRWVICDSSKPAFVVQMRTPAEVSVENPNSGDSFNKDVVRFKMTTRFNSDFIDPRFFWLGSDGSV